jgi:hypothetical protein
MRSITSHPAAETACHLDRLAGMKIDDVVAILGSEELSHRAGDTEHVELIRWASVQKSPCSDPPKLTRFFGNDLWKLFRPEQLRSFDAANAA